VPFCSRTPACGIPRRCADRSEAVKLSCTSAPFGLATADKALFGRQGVAHLRGLTLSAAMRSGLSQARMGKGAAAQDLGALYALDGGQGGWRCESDIGHLIVLQNGRGELRYIAAVWASEGCRLMAGIRIREEIRAYLVHARADVARALAPSS